MYHRKQNRHKPQLCLKEVNTKKKSQKAVKAITNRGVYQLKRSDKTIITPIKTVFTPYKDNYFISLQQKTKTTLRNAFHHLLLIHI